MNIFNICEDSLLATPLILDLAILAELLTRIQYRIDSPEHTSDEFQPLYSVLSLLSYMVRLFLRLTRFGALADACFRLPRRTLLQLKAPLVKPGTAVVNSLSRQRAGLEQFLKACLGLENNGDLLLNTRVW